MTLTKNDLINSLFETLGINKQEAKILVDRFFKEVVDSLNAGKNVRLSGFGNFVLRDKKARPGRNPKTGEQVPITPRRVVTFKAGQKLKAKVDKYSGITDSQE
jgi:integration host factor, alpha subunit